MPLHVESSKVNCCIGDVMHAPETGCHGTRDVASRHVRGKRRIHGARQHNTWHLATSKTLECYAWHLARNHTHTHTLNAITACAIQRQIKFLNAKQILILMTNWALPTREIDIHQQTSPPKLILMKNWTLPTREIDIHQTRFAVKTYTHTLNAITAYAIQRWHAHKRWTWYSPSTLCCQNEHW